VADQRGIDLPWVTFRTLIVVLMAHCRYELLILDEPTFGLGRKQKVILRSFLKECMVTKHLFVVSHDRNFVQSICDQIIDIDQNTHVHNKKINLERPQS
jgi:ATPase subunit of ABC transporter with duplicated ATPase domains